MQTIYEIYRKDGEKREYVGKSPIKEQAVNAARTGARKNRGIYEVTMKSEDRSTRTVAYCTFDSIIITRDYMGRYWLTYIFEDGHYGDRHFIYNADGKGSPYIEFATGNKHFLLPSVRKALNDFRKMEANLNDGKRQ